MQEEILTEDLLARLLTAEKPESYLDQGETIDRTLPDYLFELLADRGMKRAEVVRGSGVNVTVVYDIFAGKSVPGRDRAIMLAFGLKCDLRETQRLLRLAGASELWPKVRRDAIIIWCINQGMTRSECDDELWRLGEKTLFGTGSLR
ncbi:XRE family transcriptional regulator [uncultured Slackia sp.]|uniref:XRE family transcriptional regulator n=1 Tax=uncultured Slackia sp. TaxID=665903 RepID=UPI0025E72D02|nr:XRE family transcriptional regulator [uncultured Slackia sp.]